MKLLIDLDSILYKAVYKVVSIKEMREAIAQFGKEGAKQWLLGEVYDYGINRVEKQILEIVQYLDSVMFADINETEIFITTDKNSFRKALSKEYKAKRKSNPYVWLLRNHYKINDAVYSDTLEADDLISIRAKELGAENCIIVSIDKDLKQIGGYYFSYMKEKEYDSEGNLIINDLGLPVQVFKQKKPIFITPEEADSFFWKQMLMGDTGDGIKGLKGVGKVRAEKSLNKTTCNWVAVAREYIKRNQKEDWKINYQLLKLK